MSPSRLDRAAMFQSQAQRSYDQMPAIGGLIEGTATPNDLKHLARRHYAEVRAFLDIKLPFRMGICPHDAMAAKAFFHRIYAEEQGGFGHERNHAELFKPTCFHLGISNEELEAEYEWYSARVRAGLRYEASAENLARELATAFAWEGLTNHIGERLVRVLSESFGFAPQALEYFVVHQDADAAHSSMALEILLDHTPTEALTGIAMSTIHEALVSDLYFSWSPT